MDLIIIFGVGSAAALVGTLTGILLLRRKLRPPVTEAELTELRGKLQAGETSLVTANRDVKELRAQLALQETALQQSRQDAAKRQEQLDAEAAEKQKEKAHRAVAEKRTLELSAEIAVFTERCTGLEAQGKQERERASAIGSRLVALEGELEASKKRTQEMADQAARLVAESIELKRLHEDENRIRTEREAQLNAQLEAVRQLTTQVAELENERSQLEFKLREEISTAAKGRELLLLAQEKLSSAFKVLGSEVRNGNGSQANGNGSQANANGSQASANGTQTNGNGSQPNGNGNQAALVAALVNTQADPETDPALLSPAHSS